MLVPVTKKLALRSRSLLAVLVFGLLLSPDAHGESDLDRAAEALSRGDAPRAEALYRRVVESSPESVQGHRGLARAMAAQGKTARASSILLSLGERLIGLSVYDEAVDVTEEAVALTPASPRGHALLGRALMLQGKRLTEAEKQLEEAAELGWSDVRTLLYRAAAKWELGKVEEAEALYRQAVERTNGSPYSLRQLGRLLMAVGKSSEALGVLEIAAVRSPDDSDVMFDLARALDVAGETERAMIAYRRVVDLDPTRKHSHYGLARLMARSGDREAAQEEFEIYERLTREEHDRVREIGLAEIELGKGWRLLHDRKPEAAAALFRGLPESDESLIGLASALTSMGDRPAALQALERAAALSPGRADLQLRLIDARVAATVPEE